MSNEKQTGRAAKPRRHFDENFKRNAVELTLQAKRPMAAVARELGVTDSMLYEWRRKYAPPPGRLVGTPPSLEEATREIARLRGELVRMQEREMVLKKSLGILSETPESGMPKWKRSRASTRWRCCASCSASRAAVTTAGKTRRPAPRQREDEQLSAKIIAAHLRSRRNYGAPRLVAELRDEGTPINKRRCARLMKAHALRGRKKHRRRPRTTDSNHAHAPAANLLGQKPAPSAANQAWMTDITYIETAEG